VAKNGSHFVPERQVRIEKQSNLLRKYALSKSVSKMLIRATPDGNGHTGQSMQPSPTYEMGTKGRQ
jgi:hypothetical protein